MTPRMRQCLDAIRRLTVDGVPPSYSELRDELGMATVSNVHRLIWALKRDGLVTFQPRVARSLQIVADADRLHTLSTDALVAIERRIRTILMNRTQGRAA